MRIREILDDKGRDVMTVRPTETVATLSHRLRMARVGALVVSDDGKRMLGIVSERDIVACIAEKGAQALEAKVADIMTARVLTCREDDSISTIARRMTANRVRHIPVVEGSRLVGVVSVGDIVKNRIAEMELETGVLRDLAMAGL